MVHRLRSLKERLLDPAEFRSLKTMKKLEIWALENLDGASAREATRRRARRTRRSRESLAMAPNGKNPHLWRRWINRRRLRPPGSWMAMLACSSCCRFRGDPVTRLLSNVPVADGRGRGGIAGD